MSSVPLYFDWVQKCSFQFQWIEVSLKISIALSQTVIKQQVAGLIDFRPESEKLSKYTLGKLVDVYNRYGGYLTLIEEMRSCIKERNHLAHEAFVLKEEEQKDEVFLLRRIGELKALYERLQKIVRSLHMHITQLNSSKPLKKMPNQKAPEPTRMDAYSAI